MGKGQSFKQMTLRKLDIQGLPWWSSGLRPHASTAGSKAQSHALFMLCGTAKNKKLN